MGEGRFCHFNVAASGARRIFEDTLIMTSMVLDRALTVEFERCSRCIAR